MTIKVLSVKKKKQDIQKSHKKVLVIINSAEI